MQARNATESQERVKNKARKVAKQLQDAKQKQKADAANHLPHGSQLYEQFWAGVEGSMLLENGPVYKVSRKNASKNSQISDAAWLILPDDPKKALWDVFISTLALFSIVSVPFRLAFNLPNSRSISAVDYLFDGLFLLDLLITTNTAVYDTKLHRLETNRYVIVMKYLRFWFWIDLLSSLPMEDIARSINVSTSLSSAFQLVRTFRLLRLLKLGRIFRIERLGEHLEKLDINPALLNVFSLLFMLLGMAHLIACFWVMLARGTDPGLGWKSELSWLTAAQLENNSVIDQYVAALYWTMATILSIGYGDIHAETSSERIYAICVMLMGGVMFGAIISQISRLTESRNPSQKLVAISMTELALYLKQKDFRPAMDAKIKSAYEYYFSKKSVLTETGGILDELSHSLRSKLTRLLFEKEIGRIGIFSRLDHQLVNQIVINSKPFEADAGAVIFNYGDVSDEIVFVLSGLIRIETQSGSRDVTAGYVTDGGYFGDFEFATRSLRMCRCTAVSKCSLLSISDDTLQALFDSNYESGIDFSNEMSQRYEVFRNVIKLPAISADEAQTRSVGRRGRLGRSLRLLPTDGTGMAVRSKLWVNGDLQTHSNVTTDLNLSAYKQKSNSSAYRYAVINAQGDRVIEEGSIHHVAKKYLIHPKGVLKGYWDMVIGVLIIYSVLAVPVTVVFTQEVSLARNAFELLVDSLFLTDVLVNFRTVYLDEAEDALIAIPALISRQYVKRWFAIDFLSSIPCDKIIYWILKSSVNELFSLRLIKIIRLTRLLELARIFKLARYVRAIEARFGISILVFDLVRMVCQVLLIGHLLACAWWGISVTITKDGWFNSPEQGTEKLLETSPATQYVTSLYMIVTTLTTTGYGDLYPSNSEERIVMMIIMCMGASTFGYIVGSVAALVGTINQSAAIRTERLAAISSFLAEKGCPRDLTVSIMRHFRSEFAEVSAANEDVILERLPRSLAVELTLLEHTEKFRTIPIFAFIENSTIKVFLFKLLRHVFYDTDQFILREGDFSKEIVFLVSGSARIFHQPELRRWRMMQHRQSQLQLPQKGWQRGGLDGRRPSTQLLQSFANEANEWKQTQTGNLVLTDHSAIVDNSAHLIVTTDQAMQAVVSAQEMHSRSHRGGDNGSMGSWLDGGFGSVYSHHAGLTLNPPSAFGSAIRIEGITGASFFSRPSERVDTKHDNFQYSGDYEESSSSDIQNQETDDVVTLVPSSVEYGLDTDIDAPCKHGSHLAQGSDSAPDPPNEKQPPTNETQAQTRTVNRSKSSFAVESQTKIVDEPKIKQAPRRTRLSFGKLLLKSYESKKNLVVDKETPFHLRNHAENRHKGREVIGDLGPGDFVGHGAMMKGCELKASVRAVSPCSAYVLPKAAIVDLLDRHPGVAMALQVALGRAMSVAVSSKGRALVRSKRAMFLREIKKSGIAVIRQAAGSPARGSFLASRSPSFIFAQAAQPPEPAPASGNRRPSSAKIHPVENVEGAQPAVPTRSNSETFECGHNLASGTATSSSGGVVTDAILALEQREEPDGRLTGSDADGAGLQPPPPALPNNSMDDQRFDLSRVKQQRVQRKLVDESKDREAAVEGVLRDGRLLYDSDDDPAPSPVLSTNSRGRTAQTTLTRAAMHKIAERALARNRSYDVLQTLPKQTMTGLEFSEPSIAKNRHTVYNGIQRRQSFPSLDNDVWRHMQEHEMYL